METSTKQIPVRSRRQAMDLSLALASQGIHPTIAKGENGWALDVEATEHEAALSVIAQYQKENRRWRGWRWQHELPHSGLWFHWGSIFWCAWLVVLYYWNHVRFPKLNEMGLMDNELVARGEWWRLFTAITLHGDVSHLAANAFTGFVLLALAMAHYGPGFGLMTAYLAGAGGNLAGFLLFGPTHRSLGASGMVMGALGLIAVQTVAHWRSNPPHLSRIIWRGVAATGFILVMLGFSPQSDILAHIGGFVFGCLFGLGLNLLPRNILENQIINQVCVLLLGSWVVFTWWSAFG